MPADEPSDDDDALERAEFERENEAFERSLAIKPSRRVCPPDAELRMSPIIFNDYPLIWLGNEHTVFVYFLDGERRVDRVLDVTWTSLDPTVLPIIEIPRPITSSEARLLGAKPGITKIVASTALGHREELEVQVVDRSTIEIQWF